MTNQLPPTLPYQAPTPIKANFGKRAAMVSWLAPLAALLLFALVLLANAPVIPFSVGVAVFWIIGLVSGVMALASMRRYGPTGIRLPAVIGLCVTLVVLLLVLVFVCIVILFAGGLNLLKHPSGGPMMTPGQAAARFTLLPQAPRHRLSMQYRS